MSAVTTSIDNPAPRIFVEVTDGALTTLQVTRTHLDPQQHDELVPALRMVIDDALRRHRDDVLAEVAGTAQDPEAASALEFLDTQLRAVADLPEPPPLVTTAGRSGDGLVRAVVGDGHLTTLEVPPELLRPEGGRALESAVVTAVNEALRAGESALHPGSTEAPAEPDWAVLADRVRQLAKEDLR